MYDTVHIILLTMIILEATCGNLEVHGNLARQAIQERNQPTSVFPRGSWPYWQQTQSTFTTKTPKYCQAHHPIHCP